MCTNRNTTLKWLETQKNIIVDTEITDHNHPVRGVYGIFIGDSCEYVGRAHSIYARMFDSGHITKLMKDTHENMKLQDAVNNGEQVSIEILERVPFILDNYYKDLQRLASSENYYIDKYQKMNQCLSQVPEGKHIDIDKWNDIKYKKGKVY